MGLLVAILVLAVVFRIIVAIYLGDSTPPAKDETSYSLLAGRLAGGYGYSCSEAWYPFAPTGAPTAQGSFLYMADVANVLDSVQSGANLLTTYLCIPDIPQL
jgi:hypothetical protein